VKKHSKPKWEKVIEDFFDSMTDEEFDQMLTDTDFKSYSRFKCFCPFFQVIEDDPSQDGCTWTEDFIDWIDCCPNIERNIMKYRRKRFDIKKILASPKLRAKLLIQTIFVTQQREGKSTTIEDAARAYYKIEAERKHHGTFLF
jgi:hypothetical protein